VTDISRTSHVTTFSTDSNRVTGPAGAFELLKRVVCMHYPDPFGGVWTPLGTRGPFSTGVGVDPFGNVWTWSSMDPCGLEWTLFDGGGPFFVGVDPFGDAWTLLGVCGPFWECVDPFGSVWTLVDGCGPFWVGLLVPFR